MDGGIVSGSTVASTFTAALRIAQTVYELKAVGEQTRQLLQTTSHIDTSVRQARALRRQKSSLLQTAEKAWIDGVLKDTERAISDVASIIEPARVDMQTRFGNIGLKAKAKFVLIDSPKVTVNLARLSIASGTLSSAMGVLCNRVGASLLPIPPEMGHALHKMKSFDADSKPPPSYDEIMEFRDKRRQFSTIKPARSTVFESEPSPTVGEREDGSSSAAQGGTLLPPLTGSCLSLPLSGTPEVSGNHVAEPSISTSLEETSTQESLIPTIYRTPSMDAPIPVVVEDSAHPPTRDYLEGIGGLHVIDHATDPPRSTRPVPDSFTSTPYFQVGPYFPEVYTPPPSNLPSPYSTQPQQHNSPGNDHHHQQSSPQILSHATPHQPQLFQTANPDYQLSASPPSNPVPPQTASPAFYAPPSRASLVSSVSAASPDLRRSRTPSMFSVSTLHSDASSDAGGQEAAKRRGQARRKAWLEYQAER
jgi:hypothetical protein